MRNDIQNREDVFTLISRFYSKVRENPEIGYFFNETITDWEEHLEKLTDFWESNLFFKGIYRGNPQKAHVKVDRKNDNKISSEHFGVWLNLWFETIDELFEGELANRAKNNARKMSTHLYLKIFQSRN
ncbi:MAG: group III truncated hemoglobin [Salegentibacter sp.]|uniref:Hemoglobin n=1 Tax=Salegentibacter flavus TaxID=287099 RepID=A0A1I5APZ5_9FLAO|nr:MULTISPECIES: group III truncated hemoglobin [Salegentibacter]MDR9456628.1 group III truncated hemoglobin [Salegentibacter sp.]SFN64249.1 hemoglobin [Salegentibacter flavus]